ncbi:MAG: hypothetical protein IH991_02075, partial [Planctomycetes bacterium]|nr:hypothetical protein [Planctomycetota bacterium]
MIVFAWLDSEFSLRLVATLLHVFWLGLVLGIAAFVLNWCLRRGSAHVRYTVNLIAMLALVALVPIVYVLVGVSDRRAASVTPNEVRAQSNGASKLAFPPPAESTAPDLQVKQDKTNDANIDIHPEAVANQTDNSKLVSQNQPRDADMQLATTNSERRTFTWQRLAPIAVFIYLAGVMVMVGRLLLAISGGWRLRKNCRLVTDSNLLSIVKQQAKRVGMRAAPVLGYCERVAVPVVVGVLRPMILLPTAMVTGLSLRQLEDVLTHELAHIRRWDHLVILLQRVVEALLFFHPAVWYLSQRLRVERENCCDDLAITAGADRLAYAESLVRVAELKLEQTGQAPFDSVTALAADGHCPSRLRRRIARLIAEPFEPAIRMSRVGMLSLLLLVAGAVGGTLLFTHTPVNSEEPAALTGEAIDHSDPRQESYDHFFYVHHNLKNGLAVTDSLVMATVTPEGLRQRDVFTKRNLHIGWRPIAAIGGKVFGLKLDDLIAIDIATGRVELLCQYAKAFVHHKGRLYVLLPTDGDDSLLRAFDLPSGTQHDIAMLSKVSPIRSHVPMQVSPDGQKLALFIGEGKVFPRQIFQLTVIDLQTGRKRNVIDGVRSAVIATGGGWWSMGPRFVWLDDQNIVYIHNLPPKGEDVQQFFGPSSDLAISRVNVGSGIASDVVQLPRMKSRSLGQPLFAPIQQDHIPRIMMGKLGRYRVDVKGKRIVEDTVIGEFELTRSREPEKLLLDGKLVAQAKGDRAQNARAAFYGLSVSPDGRRVVWKNEWQGSNTALRFVDADQGQMRIVARGWFSTEWDAGDYAPLVMWAKASDVTKPAKRPIPPMAWKPIDFRPWPLPRQPVEPDKRPNVTDLIDIQIKTEKPKYKLHEPVKLIVTLTNNSDGDFSFRRPDVYTRTFSFVMKYPRGGSSLDEFDEGWELAKDELVVVKARESLTLARTIEPHHLGEHVLKCQFRQQSQNWRGTAKANSIKFVVEKSDDYEQLLAGKFNRFWKACKQEYDNNPSSCAYGRMFDLGEDSVPLMIAELEKSDNPGFRRRMGYALSSIANASALPYLEKLLRGKMQHDGPVVVESLAGMHRRKVKPDEAIRLLIVALNHQSVTLRRQSAKKLRQIYHTRVKAAFEAAIADKDLPTATIASRYLAAYEGVPLAEWLGRCRNQRTRARYLAARSIIPQLEKTWNNSKGELPSASWNEIRDDLSDWSAFARIVKAWQDWAEENARFSVRFFDEDREEWPKDNTAEPSDLGALEVQPLD